MGAGTMAGECFLTVETMFRKHLVLSVRARLSVGPAYSLCDVAILC